MRLAFGAPTSDCPAPLPRTGIHRILICHVSHTLGNTLLLTPLVQELEQVYPGAEIDIVSRNGVAAHIYGHYFNVAQLFVLPAHGIDHLLTLVRQWRGMRAHSYDLAIDTDPQSQTGRLLTLRANARYTLGFSGPRKSGHISHPVPVELAPARKGQQAVFLLRHALGNADAAHAYPLPDVQLSSEEQAQGAAALARVLAHRSQPSARRGVIGVFANATGIKRLEEAWWQRFLDELRELEAHYDLVEIVPAFGRSLLGDRYPAYFSNDLRKLASVLSALDICVIGDCGVMHLSCAVRTPTVALFIATDAAEWGPYGPHDHVIHVQRDQAAAAAHEFQRILQQQAPPDSAKVAHFATAPWEELTDKIERYALPR